MDLLYTYDDHIAGTLLDRPNRFTLRVEFDAEPERVYLRNSGGLETVLEPGRTVLCCPVENPDRKTDYDAIAVEVEEMWVTVDATLSNTVLEACLSHDALPRFEGYRLLSREPPLPDNGRTDFLIESPSNDASFVEVKSNTYVVDGVSKFPDRPTERGRRQLRSLIRLAEAGMECHVVFVVQRSDAECLYPFRDIDPEFADLLAQARRTGVTVSALTTRFVPPRVRLDEPVIPVHLSETATDTG